MSIYFVKLVDSQQQRYKKHSPYKYCRLAESSQFAATGDVVCIFHLFSTTSSAYLMHPREEALRRKAIRRVHPLAYGQRIAII